MMKKNLILGILMVSLIIQSSTVCNAVTESNSPIPSTTESTNTIDTDSLDTVLDFLNEQEEKKLQQEKLEREQKAKQEQLQREQEQLQREKDRQERIKMLNEEINTNTYLKYLDELGYYKKVYKDDEKLNIRNTILLFQADHNMSVTGVWDTETKSMLINRLVCDEFTYFDVVDKAPTDDKWIVVNKTNRTLTLYEGKKVLKKYAVAVGNPASLTKSGKFYINMKIVNPAWGGGGFAKPVKGGIPQNPLGYRWMGINRTDGSYGIHGTNSFYSIGKYISHGCIRMSNHCVEELFPLVPMKAPVWVGSGSELKQWGIMQDAFKLTTVQ